MERQAAEILRDALALPVEARSALIDSLIESLDDTTDEGAEEAWKKEIGRRVQEIDSGTVELTSWEVGRLHLRDRLEQ